MDQTMIVDKKDMTKDDLVSIYETLYDYDDTIEMKKLEIKGINKLKTEALDDFIKEYKTSKEALKVGYKIYLKNLEGEGSPDDGDDLSHVLYLIDQIYHENETEEKTSD